MKETCVRETVQNYDIEKEGLFQFVHYSSKNYAKNGILTTDPSVFR